MSKTRTSKNKNTPVVVVAGGAGFIGSHVTEALLNSGVKVIGVDDLVTGSIANIASFRRHPNYEFIECNLNQKIPESLSKASITHIISALGTDTHSQSRNATLSSLLTGSFATKNLLDLAVKTGARFLLLSTINIYDGLASSVSLQHYFGSSDIQKAQFSNYESKRYAEGLCQLYADEYNLDVRVARLSEVYGPRMDLCDKTFLDTMIQAVLGGQDLIVEHDGNQEIYLTYVEDVVYGLIKLLFAEGQNYPRSIYPFVSSEKVSVLSVAYTLRTFLPPGKEVKFVPQTTKDSQQLPTIAFDRTKKDLDWQPEVTITEGLKHTVVSFQEGKSQLIRQHKVGRDQLVTQAKVTEKSKQSPTATPKKPSTKAPDTPSIPSSPVPLIQDSSVEAVNLPYRSTPNKSEKGGSEQSKSEVGSKPPGDKAPLGQKTSWWRRLIFAAVLIGLYATLGRPVLHTTAYGVNGAVQARQAASAAKSLLF